MGCLSRSFKSCHKVVPSFPSTPKIARGKDTLLLQSFGLNPLDSEIKMTFGAVSETVPS